MRTLLIVTVAVVVALFTTTASAGLKERRERREEAIVAPLAARAPEAAAWFEEARHASEKGDRSHALELYERVSAAEPTFTPAIRRRAMILAELGRRDEGIALARKAVALENTRDNRGALAIALSTPSPKREPLDPKAAGEAISLARDSAREVPNDLDEQLTYCQVALTTFSVGELQTCSARCVALAPDEPEPYIFVTFAAIGRGDRAAAERAIMDGRARGMDPRMVSDLERVLAETEAPLWRWGRRLLIVLTLWLAGLGLLWSLGGVFSRRTLALTERLAESRNEHPGSRTMRSWYRGLLHFASVYYYASLPLVLLLSVLVGGAAILAFLYVGRIPVYLFVIAITIVLYTVKSVFKSLLIRGRDDDPGLAVDLTKHHRLAKVLREVADRVGTRPVDEVYLTAKADIAVFERGGFFRQMRGRTERCLLLGVGVLDGMKEPQFKAILAHEYGHFTNRDTAGGGVALGVRRSLLHTAVGLLQSGAAAWYNPAWLFVVSFQKIFLRISQGASRLQEVMADRVAASAYGPEAFASGLTHVVRRSVELDAHIDATLKEVIEGKLPLANLYAYEPKTSPEGKDIAAEVATLLDREPSAYDSHPKPSDRIRWVRELTCSLPPPALDAADAWALFEGRETIEVRMTDEVRAGLAAQGLLVSAPPSPQAEQAA